MPQRRQDQKAPGIVPEAFSFPESVLCSLRCKTLYPPSHKTMRGTALWTSRAARTAHERRRPVQVFGPAADQLKTTAEAADVMPPCASFSLACEAHGGGAGTLLPPRSPLPPYQKALR